MNYNPLLLIIVLLVLILSCSNRGAHNSMFTAEEIHALQLNHTQTLKVDSSVITNIDLNSFLNNNKFDFESLIKNIQIIPLETTSESLLGNIYKVILTDSLSYIFDDFKGGGIVIFDRSGKFIKRIPHGEGPGELFNLYDVAYDDVNKQLVAYQHPFLMFFTVDGKFIEQRKVPFGFYNFMITPGGYIFKTLDGYGNEHLDSHQNKTLLVTNKEFELKYAGLPVFHINANYGGYCYLYANNNNIRITQNYGDTIYRYDVQREHLEALYVIDYHEKKLPTELLEYQGREFRNKLQRNDYYYFIGEYLETYTHHAFFLRNDYRGTQTIVYRNKKTGHLIGGAEACFDLTEIPSIAFPKSVFKNSFISVYYPNENMRLLDNSSVLSSKDKQIVMNLKEDDNPVLILFQLKDF